jgi:hypothetical protein
MHNASLPASGRECLFTLSHIFQRNWGVIYRITYPRLRLQGGPVDGCAAYLQYQGHFVAMVYSFPPIWQFTSLQSIDKHLVYI